MKASSVLRLLVLLALASVISILLIFLPVKDILYALLDWVRALGPWGPPLLGVVYILATILFLPGFPLTLGAGFLFGVVVATLTVSLSSTLGASAAFLLGRTLAREWVQQRIARSPKFRALDEAIQQQGFKIVLLVRLSPAFPYNLLNYALGLSQVSFRDFVLASWLGMLPATVMYCYIGSTLKSLADLAAGKVESGIAQRVLFGLGLAATLAVTLLVTRLARKALKEAVPTQEGERHG